MTGPHLKVPYHLFAVLFTLQTYDADLSETGMVEETLFDLERIDILATCARMESVSKLLSLATAIDVFNVPLMIISLILPVMAR